MAPELKLRHRLEVAFRLFWFRFKLPLRLNIGVDKNFYASDAAVRLSKGLLPQGVRITCAGRDDGFGRQAMARISGLNFAKAFGATYVDTPFTAIGHAPGDMGAWVDAWEKRFNFGKGEVSIGSDDFQIVDYSDYLRHGHEITDKVVLRFQQCFWLGRRFPDSFEDIADSLREKFGVTPRVRTEKQIVVAVHVRRGDVGKNRNALRFTPNRKIVRAIECLREVLDELGVKGTFQVHSQGDPEDFAEFSQIGCELYLDTDAILTMQMLVEADVLLMAKSSFSYLAAIINDGVKIYEPMFDPPLSSWIVRRRDGSFDQKRAKESLAKYLGIIPPGTVAAAVEPTRPPAGDAIGRLS
jgi:hypothetical protein